MRRFLIISVAVALALAACGGSDTPFGTSDTSGDPGTTAATSAPDPSAPDPTTATSTSEAATTSSTAAPASTTSTTAAPTTTTSTTTSTTLAPLPPVTQHAALPAAESRGLIPWGQVDANWVLALHSADVFAPNWVEGPTALYLVSPQGVRYEITAWAPDGPAPWYIADWSPDGERALLHYGGFPDYHHEMRVIYLADATERTVAQAPELDNIQASFTKPTGRDIVHYRNDQTTETLECRYVDGSLFSFFTQQAADYQQPITWLYGLEGTTVVIGDATGLRLIDNQGNFVRNLDSPGDACQPLKWWDDRTILASCIPFGMLNMGNWYHQLWFVPLDGGAAANLTTAVANPQYVDFGYVDAWNAGAEVYLQWAGDCAAAFAERLHAGGPLLPAAQVSYRVVGTMGPDAVVHFWDGCDTVHGNLQRIAPDGSVVAVLLPRIENTIGVMSAVTMPRVP